MSKYGPRKKQVLKVVVDSIPTYKRMFFVSGQSGEVKTVSKRTVKDESRIRLLVTPETGDKRYSVKIHVEVKEI